MSTFSFGSKAVDERAGRENIQAYERMLQDDAIMRGAHLLPKTNATIWSSIFNSQRPPMALLVFTSMTAENLIAIEMLIKKLDKVKDALDHLGNEKLREEHPEQLPECIVFVVSTGCVALNIARLQKFVAKTTRKLHCARLFAEDVKLIYLPGFETVPQEQALESLRKAGPDALCAIEFHPLKYEQALAYLDMTYPNRDAILGGKPRLDLERLRTCNQRISANPQMFIVDMPDNRNYMTTLDHVSGFFSSKQTRTSLVISLTAPFELFDIWRMRPRRIMKASMIATLAPPIISEFRGNHGFFGAKNWPAKCHHFTMFLKSFKVVMVAEDSALFPNTPANWFVADHASMKFINNAEFDFNERFSPQIRRLISGTLLGRGKYDVPTGGTIRISMIYPMMFLVSESLASRYSNLSSAEQLEFKDTMLEFLSEKETAPGVLKLMADSCKKVRMITPFRFERTVPEWDQDQLRAYIFYMLIRMFPPTFTAADHTASYSKKRPASAITMNSDEDASTNKVPKTD